jgi:hypothetical protein
MPVATTFARIGVALAGTGGHLQHAATAVGLRMRSRGNSMPMPPGVRRSVVGRHRAGRDDAEFEDQRVNELRLVVPGDHRGGRTVRDVVRIDLRWNRSVSAHSTEFAVCDASISPAEFVIIGAGRTPHHASTVRPDRPHQPASKMANPITER